MLKGDAFVACCAKQSAMQVTPKYINSLTELIVGNIDILGQSDGDFTVRPTDRTRGARNSIQVRFARLGAD
jgi:hypothetical protein